MKMVLTLFSYVQAESLFHKALKRDKFSIDAIAGVTELLVLNRKTDEVRLCSQNTPNTLDN